MTPLPVVATIREAWSFALSQLGAIVGLIWLPMVAITVMGFFTAQRYYNDVIVYLADNNAAQLGPSMLLLMGFVVAGLLLYAVAFVPVVQLAQGERKDAPLVHFAFGALEWRLFRAFCALAGFLLGAGFLIALVGSAASRFGGTTAVGVTGLMLLGLFGIALLLVPRFLLLLPALAVNETAPALRRAWALSQGHGLRLLAILVGSFAPLLLIIVVLETLAGGRSVIPAGASEQVKMVAALMRAREALPVTYGLSFLVSPLVIGLVSGISVSVWRHLKGEPVREILA